LGLLLAPATLLAADESEVVATVMGQAITRADLEQSVAAQLKQLDDQRAQILEEALSPLVDQTLFEKVAEQRGVTAAELLATEVTGKTPAVTDADIDAWFEENKARLRNQTKEQLGDQIRSFLEQQRAFDRRSEFMQELRKEHEVKLLLEPRRIEIDLANATWKGNEDAPITVVEFSDFQCPACQGFNPTVSQLLKAYPEQVRVAFLQLPLRSIHPKAQKAAEASLCARDQDKFWEMHDAMFADQRKLEVADLKASARQIGLDGEKFDACLDGDTYKAVVDADFNQATALGATGTPSVFVNGRVVSPGRVPSIQMLSALVEDELARLK
jgi:predicted DsbA family dithiol-disulfide isomerase